jgi:DUF1680 family protein
MGISNLAAAMPVLLSAWLLTVGSQIGSAVPRDYPHQPVPFTRVQFTDAFWLPRMETNRTVTIPFAFKMCEDTHRIENFKVAGGLSDKPWQGDFGFNDSDVFKVMEGAAYALMVKPDPQLETTLEQVVSYVAAAQEESGYLYTAWTARARDHQEKIGCCYHQEPWDNLESAHELYNIGHMYEAAVAHHQATGKRSFLEVAIKSADLVCRTFGPGKNEGVPGHQEIEIGLAKLYRATGDVRYLQQAKWFLDQRGRNEKTRNPYSQNHKPVIQQTEAVGHAVRATYMYTSMADVAALTGDPAYMQAIDTIWQDVAQRKLYVTGGIGARHAGEAYGDAYELPNRTAYCETCAAIAHVFWNHRMFLFHGNAKYIDIMERSLYNGVISGVSLDGKTFFYPNPLESSHGHARSPWFGCACCPSNICRFIASVPGYVYAIRDRAVYVNLFVDSRATLEVAGQQVRCVQETDYPWNGRIRLKVTPERPASLTLKIRIPDWARTRLDSTALYRFADPAPAAPRIEVNGQAVPLELDRGYVTLTRQWNGQDTVDIHLPMPVQRVLCDERVTENVGKAALQRGPLVYCLEYPDVTGGKVLNLLLEVDAKLTAQHQDPLLGGVTTLAGSAQELRRTQGEEITHSPRAFRAIPYYAWAHRGQGPMSVWIPYRTENANPLPAPTIASQSRITTSYLSTVGNNRTDFINDQAVPKSSGDHSQGYLHFWPHKGTTEWVQYDFASPAEVSEVAVYWFDDTGRGECRIPQFWRLLYRRGDRWLPVENPDAYTVTLDGFDRLRFQPVETDALRLEIQLQDRFAGGVQEWSVR